MAIARVQNVVKASKGSSGTTVTATYGSATTAGNLLVAGFIRATNTTGAHSFPAGWTKRVTVTNGAGIISEVWDYANNPGGITSVQVTGIATAGTAILFLAEYSGALTSNPQDVTSSTTSSSSSQVQTGTTATLAGTGELGVGVAGTYDLNNSVTFSSPTNSYSIPTNGSASQVDNTAADINGVFVENTNVGTAGTGSTITVTSASGTDQYAGVVSTYQPAASYSPSSNLSWIGRDQEYRPRASDRRNTPSNFLADPGFFLADPFALVPPPIAFDAPPTPHAQPWQWRPYQPIKQDYVDPTAHLTQPPLAIPLLDASLNQVSRPISSRQPPLRADYVDPTFLAISPPLAVPLLDASLNQAALANLKRQVQPRAEAHTGPAAVIASGSTVPPPGLGWDVPAPASRRTWPPRTAWLFPETNTQLPPIADFILRATWQAEVPRLRRVVVRPDQANATALVIVSGVTVPELRWLDAAPAAARRLPRRPPPTVDAQVLLPQLLPGDPTTEAWLTETVAAARRTRHRTAPADGQVLLPLVTDLAQFDATLTPAVGRILSRPRPVTREQNEPPSSPTAPGIFAFEAALFTQPAARFRPGQRARTDQADTVADYFLGREVYATAWSVPNLPARRGQRGRAAADTGSLVLDASQTWTPALLVFDPPHPPAHRPLPFRPADFGCDVVWEGAGVVTILVAGPYYATAGQIYVAGFIAGDVQTE